MPTLRERLDMIRALCPRGPTHHGQLYRTADQLKRKYRRVTLYTVFVSDEGTHMLRPHVFEKKDARTPEQWHAWFQKESSRIYTDGILPGMALRTGKAWSVLKIIGWVGAIGAVHKTDDTKKAPRRRKATHKGGTHG